MSGMSAKIYLPAYLPIVKSLCFREENADQKLLSSNKRKYHYYRLVTVFTLFLIMSIFLNILLFHICTRNAEHNQMLIEKIMVLENKIKSISYDTTILKRKILQVHDTLPLSHNSSKINEVVSNGSDSMDAPVSTSASTANHNIKNVVYRSTNNGINTTTSTTDYSLNYSESPGLANITEYPDDLYNFSNIQEVLKDASSDFKLCDVLSSLEDTEIEYYMEICGGREHSTGRTKRSTRGNQTGRKSTKGRRGQNHKRHRTQGPVATHFKGGLPERFIQDGGSLVAPWHPDIAATENFNMSYVFREGKGSVEVSGSGLYMIYAQVYYLTSEVLNSYTINIREKGKEGLPVAFCSANAVLPNGKGVTEVSCYTSVIRYLNATNEVYLTQRDRNRRMILRDGHSFLGLVKLNSLVEPRRSRSRQN